MVQVGDESRKKRSFQIEGTIILASQTSDFQVKRKVTKTKMSQRIG